MFNTWVAECQSDFDRCMSLNDPLSYDETLWQQQIEDCLVAVGAEPVAAAYGPGEQAQYVADKALSHEQKADCENLPARRAAAEKALADYAQRETMVMEVLARIYPGGIVFYLMDYSGENSLPTKTDNQAFKKNSRSIKVNGVKYKVLAQVHTHLATDGFEGPSIEDVEWSEKAGIPIFTIGKTDFSKVDPGTHKVSNYQKYRWKLNRKKWINEENNGFKIDNTKDVRSKRKKITDSL